MTIEYIGLCEEMGSVLVGPREGALSVGLWTGMPPQAGRSVGSLLQQCEL